MLSIALNLTISIEELKLPGGIGQQAKWNSLTAWRDSHGRADCAGQSEQREEHLHSPGQTASYRRGVDNISAHSNADAVNTRMTMPYVPSLWN